jgi:diguanylate cyclase (GGDEF)-like protein/PAS domain S-box-containing protein
MRQLFEASNLALVVLDRDGWVTSWNSGAERLLGHASEEIVGRHIATLHPHDDRAAADRWLREVVQDGGREIEGWWVRRDRTGLWAGVIATPMRDEHRHLLGFLCVVRDAGDRRHADLALRKTAGEMEQLAVTDTLTGLSNRRQFDRMLRAIPREPFAILVVDVDGLKETNDRDGHQAGDLLLRSVAITLSLLVRGWDVLARIGGDEFGILLPGVGTDEAAKVADRMRVAMHSIHSCRARICVGWATGPGGADLTTVWAAADRCLYRAKRLGGDRVVGGEFASADPAPGSGRSANEVLSGLLAGGAMDAVYQPILGLDDGHVAGYEALARPANTGPSDSVEPLFSIARQTGRIRELDWMARKAAFSGARQLPHGALLFVNTSLTALLDPLHDVDQLLLLLRWAGWPVAQTVLELGGQEPVADPRRLARVLARYRAEGVRFAGDGVGEGQSTFDLMGNVRPEFVKVARRLTMTASRTASRVAIRAALDTAHASDAATIAAGVENQFAAEQMRALGVELGQGFGLGRPAPPEVIARGDAGLRGA